MKATTDVLLIDAGNTRLKWGWLSDTGIVKGGEVENPAGSGGWDIPTGKTHPSRVVVACVAADEVREYLTGWSQRKFGIAAEYLSSPAAGWGITNAYQDAARLGIDRWAAMIAAFREYSDNLCVVDAGSALTLDFVRADGRHQGGYIVPGLNRLPQCLIETTSLQPGACPGEGTGQRSPGTSTTDCIRHGALQMLCGMIETGLQQYERQVGTPVRCILTGGDAAQLAAALEIVCELEPDLVLQGIGLMAGNKVDKA